MGVRSQGALSRDVFCMDRHVYEEALKKSLNVGELTLFLARRILMIFGGGESLGMVR